MARLRLPVVHKIPGVHGRAFSRPGRHVRLFLVKRNFTRDPMVFDPDVSPHSILMQIRLDVLIIPVVIAEVAIELPVERITGVSELGAPDLLARLGVTGEDGHTLRSDHWSIDPPAWAWSSIKNRVRVGDEILDPGFTQVTVITRIECAFGKPDTSRWTPEMFDVIFPRNAN